MMRNRPACADIPLSEAMAIFFPATTEKAAIARAKTICARCPAIAECAQMIRLNEARTTNTQNRHGIWADMTPAERWAKDHPDAVKPCPRCGKPTRPPAVSIEVFPGTIKRRLVGESLCVKCEAELRSKTKEATA